MRRTRWVGLLPAMSLAWALMAPPVSAQTFGAAGRPIQIYGMVQVESGPDVITLEVKKEKKQLIYKCTGNSRMILVSSCFC